MESEVLWILDFMDPRGMQSEDKPAFLGIWGRIHGQEAKSLLEGLKTKPETKIQEQEIQSLRQDLKRRSLTMKKLYVFFF